MVLSMTGFGAAAAQEGGASYRVEIRSVNNRYFKASLKTPEIFARFEGEIERLLRDGLGRGSVTYNLRVKDEKALGYEVNVAAVSAYVRQLSDIAEQHKSAQIDLASLLEAPGVCEPAVIDESILADRFKIVQRLTREAIKQLTEMRRVEGAALRKDLQEHCRGVRAGLAEVSKRSGGVVEEYQKRLTSRIEQLLSGGTVQLDREALAREVAIFAERCDVNEETSRLASHLDQFDQLCDAAEDAGRKLDFLAQEMLREANTIGSKANDGQVARFVVEIKAAIDRIKEQVQNIA